MDSRTRFFDAISENKRFAARMAVEQRRLERDQKLMLSRVWHQKELLMDDYILINVRTPSVATDPSARRPASSPLQSLTQETSRISTTPFSRPFTRDTTHKSSPAPRNSSRNLPPSNPWDRRRIKTPALTHDKRNGRGYVNGNGRRPGWTVAGSERNSRRNGADAFPGQRNQPARLLSRSSTRESLFHASEERRPFVRSNSQHSHMTSQSSEPARRLSDDAGGHHDHDDPGEQVIEEAPLKKMVLDPKLVMPMTAKRYRACKLATIVPVISVQGNRATLYPNAEAKFGRAVTLHPKVRGRLERSTYIIDVLGKMQISSGFDSPPPSPSSPQLPPPNGIDNVTRERSRTYSEGMTDNISFVSKPSSVGASSYRARFGYKTHINTNGANSGDASQKKTEREKMAEGDIFHSEGRSQNMSNEKDEFSSGFVVKDSGTVARTSSFSRLPAVAAPF